MNCECTDKWVCDDCFLAEQRADFDNGNIRFVCAADDYDCGDGFWIDVEKCQMCCDKTPGILTGDGYMSICFDCAIVLSDWYNENVVRPEVSQVIDEILTEDADTWRGLAGC